MSTAPSHEGLEILLTESWWTRQRLRACCWRTEGKERVTVAQQLGVALSTLKDWEQNPCFQALRRALLREELQHQQAARTRPEQLQDMALRLLEACLEDARQHPEAYSPQDVIALLQVSVQLLSLSPARVTPADPQNIKSGQPPLPDAVPGPEPHPQPPLPAAELPKTAGTTEAEVMSPATTPDEAPIQEDTFQDCTQRCVVRLPKNTRQVVRGELVSSSRTPVRPGLAGRGLFLPPPEMEPQEREVPAADP